MHNDLFSSNKDDKHSNNGTLSGQGGLEERVELEGGTSQDVQKGARRQARRDIERSKTVRSSVLVDQNTDCPRSLVSRSRMKLISKLSKTFGESASSRNSVN